MAPPKPPAVAALYVARRQLTLAAVGADHRIGSVRAAPNPPRPGATGPEVDIEHVWRWLVAALGSLGEDFRIEAVVPIAHPATLARIDGRSLTGPLRLADDGDLLPLLTEAPPATRWTLGHAQYWGFRLTDGALAAEASSLGEASSLIEARGARPTTALRQLGRHQWLPAMLPPHEVLGRLAAEVADRAELPTTTPVLVGAGDLAARHGRLLGAGWETAALIVVDDAGCRVVAGTSPVEPSMIGLDGRPLALFTVRDAGPVVRAPDQVRAAALRGALVLDHALDRLASRGPVVIEGSLAADTATLGLLAALRAPRGQAVFAGADPHPLAQAASLLWGLRQRRPAPRLDLVRIAPAPCPHLERLKDDWRLAFDD
ncbi:MAG: hypothetical protein EA356_01415 [Geminicoccaceae bacterium]|nr:MAG: hypothetical protein EA356_01415 [Geminicoccaceae bacterium]